MNKIDPYGDNTAEKIACGMIAHLLLKDGYSASFVAKAVHVPESFAKYMEEDGVKNGLFPGASKTCNKVLENRVRVDRTDFLACHRRILSPETPKDIFCQIWGMSLTELELAERYIGYWAKDGQDPLRFLVDAKPKKKKGALAAFIESHCELGSSHQCDLKVFFEAWNKWRSTHNVKEVPIQSLSKKLKKLFMTIDVVRYRTGSGPKDLSRKYIGIGLKVSQ